MRRSDLSRTLSLFPAMVLWTMGIMFSCSHPREELPNILLIVADDLGYKDVGFMGSGYYETPHLDRLAGEGRGTIGTFNGMASKGKCPCNFSTQSGF